MVVKAARDAIPVAGDCLLAHHPAHVGYWRRADKKCSTLPLGPRTRQSH
jgi:hypothetical protein